ncbi:MAG: hypothetical protein LUE24_01835 [Lachnospiraceae bacterium]|nr:hypothetical protein [Lachnospiraceae bacterium]
MAWVKKVPINRFGYTNVPVLECPFCSFWVCDVLNSAEVYRFCPACGRDVTSEVTK